MRFRPGRVATLVAPLSMVVACGDTSASGEQGGARGTDAAPGDVVTGSDAGETDGAGTLDSGTAGEAAKESGGANEADAGPPSDDATGMADASASMGDATVVAPDAGGFADAAVGISGPSSFHCVNWADQRDNFVNGLLQPSGLHSGTDTYATVQTTANAILSGFATELEANAIRVPINEPTVSSTWWSAYKGLIDSALAKSMKVIIAYWAWHNGKPDSTDAYNSMWQVVVNEYASNNLVFFDIHNEPFGFSTADWITFAAAWISKFPSVPRSRIIVAGSGYDQNVTAVASNSQFDGCLFSLHVYTFFSKNVTTVAGWQSLISSSLGAYAPRTIVTEWGAPMTTGVTYNAAGTGGTDQAYMAGTPGEIHTLGIGSCYWPGLRIGDAWSITTLNGTGASPTLSVNNTSGLDRIHFAWGL
jgi:hypothetical protein